MRSTRRARCIQSSLKIGSSRAFDSDTESQGTALSMFEIEKLFIRLCWDTKGNRLQMQKLD